MCQLSCQKLRNGGQNSFVNLILNHRTLECGHAFWKECILKQKNNENNIKWCLCKQSKHYPELQQLARHFPINLTFLKREYYLEDNTEELSSGTKFDIEIFKVSTSWPQSSLNLIRYFVSLYEPSSNINGLGLSLSLPWFTSPLIWLRITKSVVLLLWTGASKQRQCQKDPKGSHSVEERSERPEIEENSLPDSAQLFREIIAVWAGQPEINHQS